MEKVSSKKDHIDLTEHKHMSTPYPCKSHILCFGQLHNLVETSPTIIFSNWIPFFVANMAVCRNEYAYSIGSCEIVSTMLNVKRKETNL